MFGIKKCVASDVTSFKDVNDEHKLGQRKKRIRGSGSGSGSGSMGRWEHWRGDW
jgi:hypothetical protein